MLGTEEKNAVKGALERSHSRVDCGRILLNILFTDDEMARSNVNGTNAKKQLNPVKIALIKNIVFEKYKLTAAENYSEVERLLFQELNTKCRGKLKNLKRRLTKFSAR